jgi:hypothetical protein
MSKKTRGGTLKVLLSLPGEKPPAFAVKSWKVVCSRFI